MRRLKRVERACAPLFIFMMHVNIKIYWKDDTDSYFSDIVEYNTINDKYLYIKVRYDDGDYDKGYYNLEHIKWYEIYYRKGD